MSRSFYLYCALYWQSMISLIALWPNVITSTKAVMFYPSLFVVCLSVCLSASQMNSK